MSNRHLFLLLTIVLAIAMTSCGSKPSPASHSSNPAPQSTVELNQKKLAPIPENQIGGAKELLKALGQTGALDRLLLNESDPTEAQLSQLAPTFKSVAADIIKLCTFSRHRTAPEITPEKIRVGAQFTFSRDYQSQGSGCPVNLKSQTDANLTFWSVDPSKTTGTIRTRAEISHQSEFKDARFTEILGYSAAQFKFRVIEDGQSAGTGSNPKAKSHFRSFGGGHMTLTQKGRVELRTRVEQLSDQGKKSVVMRIRAKTPQGQNFNYAFQIEITGGGGGTGGTNADIRIVKAYVGNILLSEGEIGDLHVATLAERFILSIH